MKVHFKADGKEYFIDAKSVLLRLASPNKYHVAVSDGDNWYELYLDETNKRKLVGCLGSGNIAPIEASEK